MKTLLAIALSLLKLNTANSADCPNLQGTWQSSKEMSMAYNNQQASLEQRQVDFLNQVLGIMKLTYTEDTVHEHGQPPVAVTINGKTNDFHFDEMSCRYEVLSCTRSTVTIRYHHPAGAVTQVLNFDSEDVYWLSPDILPTTREHFVRVQLKEQSEKHSEQSKADDC